MLLGCGVLGVWEYGGRGCGCGLLGGYGNWVYKDFVVGRFVMDGRKEEGEGEGVGR